MTAALDTIFVWSHPRALSTALLRSLAELPHATTVLEPFMIPWQAEIGFLDRKRHPNPPNYQDIITNIQSGEYAPSDDTRIQVVKDMACHGGLPLLKRIIAALPHAKHVLLIRHPYRAIPSYFRAIAADPLSESYTKELIQEDTSYDCLLQYAQRFGAGSFLLVDADDLVRTPATSLQALCDYLGLAYSPSLLNWKPDALPPTWRDLDAFEGWLDNVASSSGWQERPELGREVPYPSSCTVLERECIDAHMPVYRELVQYASNDVRRSAV